MLPLPRAHAGVANFQGANFLGVGVDTVDFAVLDGTGNVKDIDVNFAGATFSGNSYFNRANFAGYVDFSSTTFEGDLHANNAVFAKKVCATPQCTCNNSHPLARAHEQRALRASMSSWRAVQDLVFLCWPAWEAQYCECSPSR